MKRREFLQAAATTTAFAATAGLPSPQHCSAQRPSKNNPVLVVIFLRGGQDQLSTIVPYNERAYYDLRPTVAVPAEAVIKLNNQWGLHPALKSLKPFFDDERVAVVLNSGSPHSTRSHFDAQDFMEYGAPGDRTMRDGWLNRFLQATHHDDAPELRAVAMQELLPRSLRGKVPVVAVPPNLREIEEVLELFENFYGGNDPAGKPATGIGADPVIASGKETIDGLRRLRELLYQDDEALYGARTSSVDDLTFQEYPGHWFGTRMKAIAKLIKQDVGLEIVGTDVNGWDHHIGMGAVDGTLNRMLSFLADGLAAFMSDLGPALDRTVILLCTEFGRVCKENGNDGSDHGHGGPMWLMGGGVQGGIYGNWAGLAPGDLHDKRDLPVSTDYRDVFSEVLQEHLKFKVPPGFFPKFQSQGTPGIFS